MTFSSLSVGIGLFGGLLLGGLYFGGLWLSVMRIQKIERKKMFLFLSWVVRSVLLCVGLYFLARYNATSLLCGAIGLLAARSVIVRAVKRKLTAEKVKEMPAC